MNEINSIIPQEPTPEQTPAPPTPETPTNLGRRRFITNLAGASLGAIAATGMLPGVLPQERGKPVAPEVQSQPNNILSLEKIPFDESDITIRKFVLAKSGKEFQGVAVNLEKYARTAETRPMPFSISVGVMKYPKEGESGEVFHYSSRTFAENRGFVTNPTEDDMKHDLVLKMMLQAELRHTNSMLPTEVVFPIITAATTQDRVEIGAAAGSYILLEEEPPEGSVVETKIFSKMDCLRFGANGEPTTGGIAVFHGQINKELDFDNFDWKPAVEPPSTSPDPRVPGTPWDYGTNSEQV